MVAKIEELSMVFLDIETPELDWIEAERDSVKKSEQQDYYGDWRGGAVRGGLRYRDARFVTKPFVKEEVEEALDAAMIKVWEQKTIELSMKRISYQIYQKEITYVRAFNGYTEYAVNGQWMRKEITLEEAEKLLDDHVFARVSRQYLVNLAYVRNYKNGLFLLGDIRFQVARRQKKEFEKKYVEYDLRYR